MTMRILHRVIDALVGVVFLSVCSSSQADPNESESRVQPTDCWEIHSLGTLGGNFSNASALNDAGQVVGNAATEPRILDPADPPWTLVRPFISAPNGGAITEILTPGYFFGYATAINNAGQVVGNTTLGRSFPVSYVTDPGGGNVRATLGLSDARDINNVGQTLWDQNYSYSKAVIGPNEQADLLGTDLIEVMLPVADVFTTFVVSVALNDAGQVAVNASESYGSPVAYRWSSYEGAIRLAPDADGSYATGMNDAGQVIGTLQHGGVGQAFVTRRHNTSLILLGNPGDGNIPRGINNFSQIVGTRTMGGEVHGYVTVPLVVHRSIDLDTLDEVTRDGWSTLRPVAINNRGQIAGTGTLNGEDRAFLLSPQSILAYIPDHDGKHGKCYR